MRRVLVMAVLAAVTMVGVAPAVGAVEPAKKFTRAEQKFVKDIQWLAEGIPPARLVKWGWLTCRVYNAYGSRSIFSVADDQARAQLKAAGLTGNPSTLMMAAAKFLCPTAGEGTFRELTAQQVFQPFPPGSPWQQVPAMEADELEFQYRNTNELEDFTLPLSNAAALNSLLIFSGSSGKWYQATGVCVEFLDAAGAVVGDDCGGYSPGRDPVNNTGTGAGTADVHDYPTAVAVRVSSTTSLVSLVIRGDNRCRVKPLPAGMPDVDPAPLCSDIQLS